MRAILIVAAAALAGPGLAQEALVVAGHEITLTHDEMGMAALAVDGQVLIEDGAVFLDEAVQDFGGLSVLTGIAGAGGNACGAAPFVLELPERAAPVLHGPLDSCREFALEVQEAALVFSTEPLPSMPGEVWVWTPDAGLTAAAPVAFAADPALGWEALDSLALAHPSEALRLAPVLAALQGGLGAGYPAFAERISDLGSGDLVPGGYLGQACLKFTCTEDWALLYLDRAGQGVFAAWAVGGEVLAWPGDMALWPDAAVEALRGAMGG